MAPQIMVKPPKANIRMISMANITEAAVGEMKLTKWANRLPESEAKTEETTKSLIL